MLSRLHWPSALPVAILLGAACMPVEALPSTGGVVPLNQPAQAKPAASARPRVQPVDPPLSPLVTVRVGMLSQNSDAGLFIANDKGYFREQGIEMESLPFQNAQEMVGPLGSDQLDVGSGATSAGLLNAVARDVPIRIVADKGSTPPGFGFQGLVVRQDLIDRGAFGGCSSFKGYRIAVPGVGLSPEPAIERALSDCGLGLGDIEIVPLGFPEMPAAARNGAIDAAILIEPLLTSSLANGTIGLYKRTDQFYPNQQIAVLLYAPHIVAQQRAVGERFMLAYVRALRDHWDAFTRGLNKSEILDILSRHTAAKDHALLQQLTPVGLNPDGYVNMNTFSDDVEWWFNHGYVQRRVDPTVIVDNSFVDYAIERLGRYTPR